MTRRHGLYHGIPGVLSVASAELFEVSSLLFLGPGMCWLCIPISKWSKCLRPSCPKCNWGIILHITCLWMVMMWLLVITPLIFSGDCTHQAAGIKTSKLGGFLVPECDDCARVQTWVTWSTLLPGLVNIQKAIENGHRNSGLPFTH